MTAILTPWILGDSDNIYGLANSNSPLWSLPLIGSIEYNPNGNFYHLDALGHISAYDSDRNLLWDKSIPATGVNENDRHPFAIDASRIYVTLANDNKVTIYDIDDGTELDDIPFTAPLCVSVNTSLGYIFIASNDVVACHDINTLSEIWSNPLGSTITEVSPVSDGGCLVARYNGTITRLNDQGSTVWQESIATNDTHCCEVGPNDEMFIGARSDGVIRIDPDNGQVLWDLPLAARAREIRIGINGSLIVSRSHENSRGGLLITLEGDIVWNWGSGEHGRSVAAYPGRVWAFPEAWTDGYTRVTFVGSDFNQGPQVDPTIVPLDVPSDTIEGDLMVASIYSRADISDLSGWDTLGYTQSNNVRHKTFIRVATDNEPTTYNFPVDTTTNSASGGGLSVFRNQRSWQPYVVSIDTSGDGSFGELSTGADGIVYSSLGNRNDFPGMPDEGFNLLWGLNNTSGAMGIAAYYQIAQDGSTEGMEWGGEGFYTTHTISIYVEDGSEEPSDFVNNAFLKKASDLPGFVACWTQGVESSNWFDDGSHEMHLTALGASWNLVGGPGIALPGYWSLDGIDDLLRRLNHDNNLNLGSTGDGSFWIAYWVRRIGSQGSFATMVGKGDNTYQVRANNDSGGLRLDVRGGTGGTVAAESNGIIPTAEWVFVIAQQHVSPNVIVTYRGTTEDPPSLIDSSSRTGTVGTDTNSTFVVGAQDNAGSLRRFYRGDFAAVTVGTGAFLNATQREELWASTFEELDEFDPTNFQVIVDGTTAHLSWDASPLFNGS